MPALYAVMAAAACAFALASCGGGGSNADAAGTAPPAVRVIDVDYNATTDYDILVNNASVATNLAFGMASPLTTEGSGSVSVEFEPPNTTVDALSVSVAMATGYNYSVFALEDNSALVTLTVATTNATVPTNQARLSFIHAMPSQGALDFYITGPTATDLGSMSFPALAYAGDNTSPAPDVVVMASGDYRIRAVANGDSTLTVVYDSGPITLASGTDLLMAVVPTSGSASPFTLMTIDDSNNVAWMPDQRVEARTGNFVPGLGGLDTYLDPPGDANSSTTLFTSDVSSGSVTTYQGVLPGSYIASMPQTGQVNAYVSSTVSLTAASSTSLFAVGLPNQASPYGLQIVSLTDNLTAPQTGYTSLRMAALSPDLQYNYPDGVDVVTIDPSNTTAPITGRLATALAYPGGSGYFQVAGGSYTFAVVPTGRDTPLLPSSSGVALSLNAGSVQTLAIAGCLHPATGICGNASTQLELLIFTDR
jgi:hypothetical protein